LKEPNVIKKLDQNQRRYFLTRVKELKKQYRDILIEKQEDVLGAQKSRETVTAKQLRTVINQTRRNVDLVRSFDLNGPLKDQLDLDSLDLPKREVDFNSINSQCRKFNQEIDRACDEAMLGDAEKALSELKKIEKRVAG